MPRKSIAKYLNPWMFQREKKRRRFEDLRKRDGDKCWRCRRPMRFDLPRGHDQAPTIQTIGGGDALDDFCLTHGRCITEAQDHTAEVKERMRRKSEAELFAKSRKGRKKAA